MIRPRTAITVAAVAIATLALGQVTQHDAERQQDWLTSYCTDAAVWAAEEARGVPLNQRTGQPDYREIAAESCPGMRPAAPALDEYRTAPRFDMPNAQQSPIQVVHF